MAGELKQQGADLEDSETELLAKDQMIKGFEAQGNAGNFVYESFEFYNPLLPNPFFTFSAEAKKNELEEARANGARLDSVNCGPGNTTDPVLEALHHEELRQEIEVGLPSSSTFGSQSACSLLSCLRRIRACRLSSCGRSNCAVLSTGSQ